MSFLPIAHREIQLAALRPSTYYLRSAAVIVPLICLAYLVVFTETGAFRAQRLGPSILVMISSVAFAYCMMAGAFFTSDSISAEKRDGTIGLLFLTKLRAYDITAGKLIAQSIPAFYGLVSGIPILALSLLFGGTTQRQFIETSFALLITLLLSLAVGMFSSSIYRDARRSVMLTVLILVTLCFGIPFIDRFLNGLIPGYIVEQYLLLASPFVLLKTAWSGISLAPWWHSFGTLAGIAGCAFCAATFFTSRWNRQESRDRPVAKSKRKASDQSSKNSVLNAREGRGDAKFPVGSREPYLWLARQSFSRSGSQWLLFGAGSLALMVMFLQPTTMPMAIALYSLIPFHVIFKMLLSIDAARALNTARRTGLLELLMVTPNPIQRLPQALHQALRKHYSGLSKLLVATNLVAILGFFFEFIIRSRADGEAFFMLSHILLGGIFILHIDQNAITWLGLRSGLRHTKPFRGSIMAMGRAMALSWIGLLILFGFFAGISPQPTTASFFILIWQIASIFDVVVGGQFAKRDLEQNFARYYHEPQ